MTLLHSVWQMAILLVLYYFVVFLFTKWPPLAKRNLLLGSIAIQFVSSIVTFVFIYFGEHQNMIYGSFNLEWISPSTSVPPQLFTYLLVMYSAGIFYKLLGSYLKWRSHLAHIKANLHKAPAELRLFTAQRAFAFGIKRHVEIWLSDNISSPLTYGFFKPVILFPIALCSRLTIGQTEALIVHELTHIRTRDYFFNWLLVIADAIYFFNPFIKIAAKQIRLEREKNCDVSVIDFKYSAVNYAEALLQVVHYSSSQQQMVLAAAQDKNELLKRIQFFSQTNLTKKSNYRIWPAASLMLCLLVFLSLAVLNLSKRPKKNLDISGGPIVLHTGFEERHDNETFAVFTEPVDPATEFILDNKDQKNGTAKPTSAGLMSLNNNDEAIAIEKPLAEASTIDLQTASLIHAVSFTAEAQPEVKEMIVTEENSTGEKITKSFTVVLQNGEWKVQPQWMYTERAISDSLKAVIRLDSTTYRVFPTIQ